MITSDHSLEIDSKELQHPIMNTKCIITRNGGAINQFLAGALVLLLLINYGISVGWSSPAIGLLTSDDTPLPSGKITMNEASWLVSLIPMGGLVGNFVYGFSMNWFGRKWTMIGLSLPLAISGFIIVFAQNVYYLYAARALHGLIDGGVQVSIAVYFVEIANDNIRGVLSSLLGIGLTSGILLAYTLGNYCDYYTTPNYVIVTSIIFALIFSMFPETPMFLMRQNRIKEAEKSLRFFKRIPETDEKTIQYEIGRLKNIVGTLESKKSNGNHLKWSDFTTKPGSRAMTIAIVLSVLVPLSGLSAMISYTATIFNASGSALTSNTSAMIVGIVQLIGTLIVTPLIDRSGRRFLYMTSTIGTAFGQIALGVYIMLNSRGVPVDAYNWFPIVAFSTVIFFSACAILSLCIAVPAEVLPDKIKEVGVTFSIILMNIFGFLAMKFLPFFADFIGYDGCMFFFAAACLLGTVIIFKILPETKNKNYEDIMISLIH